MGSFIWSGIVKSGEALKMQALQRRARVVAVGIDSADKLPCTRSALSLGEPPPKFGHQGSRTIQLPSDQATNTNPIRGASLALTGPTER